MIPTGIDLGSKTSTLALFEDGRARAVPDRYGRTLRPTSDPSPDRGELLAELVAGTSELAGENLDPCVLTIPSAAGLTHRRELESAAQRTGLTFTRQITTPAACAVHHAIRSTEEQTILVVDIGATSLGAALVEIGDDLVVVVANESDTAVGGIAWRDAVATRLRQQAYAARHVDLYSEPAAERRLQLLADEVLLALNDGDRYHADLSGIDPRCHQLQLPFTAADLEQAGAELIARLRTGLEALLSRRQPDFVLLTGGTARLPLLRTSIQELAPGVRTRFLAPETAALGAAVEAGILGGYAKDVLLLASTTQSIGIVTHGGRVLPVLPKDTCIPARILVEVIGPSAEPLLLHLVEGNAEWLHDCTTIAYAELPRRESWETGPRRAVLDLDVDANNVLHLEASDRDDDTRVVLPVRTDAFTPQNPLHRYPYAHALEH